MIRLMKMQVVVKLLKYLKGKGPVVKTADASLIIMSAKPENKKTNIWSRFNKWKIFKNR